MRKTLRYHDTGIDMTATFTTSDPHARLTSIQASLERVHRWRRLAAVWARDEKRLTFAEIGRALGISRQAATKLYAASGSAGEYQPELPLTKNAATSA